MDDPFLMGVLDGLAYRQEKFQSVRNRKPVFVAIVGDREAGNQLHDEERLSGIGGSRVEYLGDVLMIHHRQRLPFGFESGDDLFVAAILLDQLQRHPSADRFLLLRQPDFAHPAFADFLKQFVRADDSGFGVVSCGHTGGPVRIIIRSQIAGWIVGHTRSDCEGKGSGSLTRKATGKRSEGDQVVRRAADKNLPCSGVSPRRRPCESRRDSPTFRVDSYLPLALVG